MAINLLDLPKTELHLHLEGAISPTTLLTLVNKYGTSKHIVEQEALAEQLRFRNFEQFLETWMWMTESVREPDDFILIAQGVAEHLATLGVVYAELHFSPPDFMRHGLDICSIATAVRTGLDSVESGPRVGLIIDLCRQYGPEAGARWLEEAAEVSTQAGIIGVGLGGPEHLAPPEPYEGLFRRAAELGFRRVAHAGEAASSESVWGALRKLGAERIGHGVRSIEDEDLIKYLAKNQIPIEVCPTSNVCTRAVASLKDHPIRLLFDAGVKITLSSDDPTFFCANIVDEYNLLRERFGFTDQELLQIARNGFEEAFLEENERKKLLTNFDQWRTLNHTENELVL